MNDDGYIRTKARHAMLALATNLRRAHGCRYVVGPTPTRSGTAVIVGAGPSVTESLIHIERLQREGASIFCTNTGLRVLASAGIVPDYVVVREALDVSAQLAHPYRHLVLDLGAHPATFTGNPLVFIAGAIQCFELAAICGVRPLYGGPAALTGAVALAENWGAREIVLTGADLCFAGNGAAYAVGSVYGDMRGANEGDMIALSGLDAQTALNAPAGVPYPERQRVVEVPHVNGGVCYQIEPWADQRSWLETHALRWSGITLLDASEGCHKLGWQSVFLRYVEAQGGVTPPTGTLDTLPAIEAVRRQIETVRGTTAAARAGGPIGAIPGLAAGCEIVEATAAGDLLRIRELIENPRDGVMAGCEALDAACRDIEERIA